MLANTPVSLRMSHKCPIVGSFGMCDRCSHDYWQFSLSSPSAGWVGSSEIAFKLVLAPP